MYVSIECLCLIDYYIRVRWFLFVLLNSCAVCSFCCSWSLAQDEKTDKKHTHTSDCTSSIQTPVRSYRSCKRIIWHLRSCMNAIRWFWLGCVCLWLHTNSFRLMMMELVQSEQKDHLVAIGIRSIARCLVGVVLWPKHVAVTCRNPEYLWILIGCLVPCDWRDLERFQCLWIRFAWYFCSCTAFVNCIWSSLVFLLFKSTTSAITRVHAPQTHSHTHTAYGIIGIFPLQPFGLREMPRRSSSRLWNVMRWCGFVCIPL